MPASLVSFLGEVMHGRITREGLRVDTEANLLYNPYPRLTMPEKETGL